MALELSTIGIEIGYAVESTAGTVPTSFTKIPNVTSIGELSMEKETIEVTDLDDTGHRYIPGLLGNSDTCAIGVNLTAAFRTTWEACITASETGYSGGKRTWWQVKADGFGQFIFEGRPSDIGLPEIGVGEALAGEVSLTIGQVNGWSALS